MRYSLVCAGLLVCLTPIWGQRAKEKTSTITYLRSLKQPDGGFAQTSQGEISSPKSSLRASLACVRALKYFGGEAPDQRTCQEFVASCFDKQSGGFSDRPGGRPDVTHTAIGLMAAQELKLETNEYQQAVFKYLGENVRDYEEIRIAAAAVEAVHAEPPAAQNWLKQILAMQKPDGTFGDGTARVTGGAVVAVLRLGGTTPNADKILAALKQGQRTDGGFGKEGAAASDLETSYRVMRAFSMLKEKPEIGRLRTFIARCRNADGGYGLAPGQPSTATTTYFAAIISHWADGLSREP